MSANEGTLRNRTLAQERAQIEVAERNAKRLSGVYDAKTVIEDAIRRHGKKIAVAWSGGRCSTAILHLALQFDPGVKVFHAKTGVKFPETRKYIRKIKKEWDLNYYEYEPRKNFWKCTEEYGFPPIRKAYSKGEPRCCYWLKKEPMKRFAEEEDIDAVLVGLRVAEARVRMFTVSQHGQFYWSKRGGLYKYNPIAFWTTRRLLDYHDEHGIPKNPIYESRDRDGCWPCTAYVGWKEQLRETNFKLYKLLLEKIGDDQKLLEHFERTRVKPCADRG